MTLEAAKKWLKMQHKIRRRSWPQQFRCKRIATNEQGRLYMIMDGDMPNQQLTSAEVNANDWEPA